MRHLFRLRLASHMTENRLHTKPFVEMKRVSYVASNVRARNFPEATGPYMERARQFLYDDYRQYKDRRLFM